MSRKSRRNGANLFDQLVSGPVSLGPGLTVRLATEEEARAMVAAQNDDLGTGVVRHPDVPIWCVSVIHRGHMAALLSASEARALSISMAASAADAEARNKKAPS